MRKVRNDCARHFASVFVPPDRNHFVGFELLGRRPTDLARPNAACLGRKVSTLFFTRSNNAKREQPPGEFNRRLAVEPG